MRRLARWRLAWSLSVAWHVVMLGAVLSQTRAADPWAGIDPDRAPMAPAAEQPVDRELPLEVRLGADLEVPPAVFGVISASITAPQGEGGADAEAALERKSRSGQVAAKDPAASDDSKAAGEPAAVAKDPAATGESAPAGDDPAAGKDPVAPAGAAAAGDSTAANDSTAAGDPAVAADGSTAAVGSTAAGDPEVTDSAAWRATLTAVDVGAYLPPGHTVAVVLVLDRFVGTPWEDALREVLSPLPDYRAIVGTRNLRIARWFDRLVIASTNPRRIDATLVAGHLRRAGRTVETDLLSGARWTEAFGARRGVRSAVLAPGVPDRRDFWRLDDGWILLAAADAAGAPRLASLTLPAWKHNLRALQERFAEAAPRPPARPLPASAGEPSAPASLPRPAVIGTVRGLPRNTPINRFVSIPGPDRVTGALEIVRQGFIARAMARFSTEARAKSFVEAFRAAKSLLFTSASSRQWLERVHAQNLLKGLSLRRSGRTVAMASSLSIRDGQAMFAAVARELATYFHVGGSGRKVPGAAGAREGASRRVRH